MAHVQILKTWIVVNVAAEFCNCQREGNLIDYPPRKAKVIAALNEISPAWACGMAVKNANSANSQNLTGGGGL